MANDRKVQRPNFETASNAWRNVLKEKGLPADCTWIFDENICFEKDTASPGGVKLGFQTALTPPPPDSEKVAYDHFIETDARIVFYRIGSSQGKSVCLLLCDEWFENKKEVEGFVRRDDWLISFHPGTAAEIEEIQDEQRYKNRILRDRPLHDLDFCMSLRGVHEILAHGYMLTAYDRYALRFLHAWRHLLGQS